LRANCTFAVEYFEIPSLAIRHIYALEVFAVEHGMRLLDPGYVVDGLASLEIKNQNSLVGLRSRKRRLPFRSTSNDRSGL